MEPNHNFAQDSEIGSVVEPMVWVYIEDIDRFKKLWCISFHSAQHQALNQHHQCKPQQQNATSKKNKTHMRDSLWEPYPFLLLWTSGDPDTIQLSLSAHTDISYWVSCPGSGSWTAWHGECTPRQVTFLFYPLQPRLMTHIGWLVYTVFFYLFALSLGVSWCLDCKCL